MNTVYFKVEAKYNRPEEGTDQLKEVTEHYLFRADNYTDAETQAHAKMEEIIPGSSFLITKIEKLRLAAILNKDGADTFWLSKAYYLIEGTKRGTFKKVTEAVLVNAPNAANAISQVDLSYSTISGARVTSVAETTILEVFDTNKVENLVEELMKAAINQDTREEESLF